MTISEWKEDFKSFINELQMPRDDYNGIMSYIDEGAELLKEQEPEPILYRDNRFTGLPVATCPKCGRFAQQFHSECHGEETKFCPWCGQAVKWDGID